MKKRALTLLELIISLVSIFVALGVLTTLILFHLNAQKKIAASPLVSEALIMESAVQSIFRSVNISSTAVASVSNDKETLIWKTQDGKFKRLKFNPADHKLYFDENYGSMDNNDSFSGSVILKDAEGVNFDIDPDTNRVLLELAASYIIPNAGGAPVKKIAALRTGIRPPLVKTLGAEKGEIFMNVSPAIEGLLVSTKKENDGVYALVEADALAMHTPEGFIKLNKEPFYVKIIPTVPIENYIGKQVMFNGDILPRKDGHYIMMNLLYGGGLIEGEDKINAARTRILEGKEAWYNNQTENLKNCFAKAKKQGKNISDWKQAWAWMIYYYTEYVPSLEKKGTVKVTYPLK